MIAFEMRGKLELRARKAKAWKNFWAHVALPKGNLPMGAKIKILKQSVIPAITYRALTRSEKRTKKTHKKTV